jgi:hypothetical protein
MAGLALPEPTGDSSEGYEVQVDRDAVRVTAAKLYGQGLERAKIARVMVNLLVPHRQHRPLEQRISQARTKLRQWEMSQDFRDLVYQHAVVKLDMATPGIFNALVKSARKGRVDASRLVLELTGRHNPKGDTTPTQVIVAFNGMPRPILDDPKTLVIEQVAEDGSDEL